MQIAEKTLQFKLVFIFSLRHKNMQVWIGLQGMGAARVGNQCLEAGWDTPSSFAISVKTLVLKTWYWMQTPTYFRGSIRQRTNKSFTRCTQNQLSENFKIAETVRNRKTPHFHFLQTGMIKKCFALNIVPKQMFQLQILREKQDEVHWHHHRDETRLLSQETFEVRLCCVLGWAFVTDNSGQSSGSQLICIWLYCCRKKKCWWMQSTMQISMERTVLSSGTVSRSLVCKSTPALCELSLTFAFVVICWPKELKTIILCGW